MQQNNQFPQLEQEKKNHVINHPSGGFIFVLSLITIRPMEWWSPDTGFRTLKNLNFDTENDQFPFVLFLVSSSHLEVNNLRVHMVKKGLGIKKLRVYLFLLISYFDRLRSIPSWGHLTLNILIMILYFDLFMGHNWKKVKLEVKFDSRKVIKQHFPKILKNKEICYLSSRTDLSVSIIFVSIALSIHLVAA